MSKHHEVMATAFDYEKLKRKKASGGNCEGCKFSQQQESLVCTMKRNKTVNRFAICQHFEENMQQKFDTNKAFITDLMESSYHGPLTEVFILESIRRYAEIIVAQPKPTDPGTSFISAIAWHEIAEEVHARMEIVYGEPK